LPKHSVRGAALPAIVAASPLLVEGVRACTTGARLWFWGDQALIDLEARNSVIGRNLLGVYDRYGWHHLGPLWLLILGVFRWLGGGSPAALALGSYMVQAVAVAAIVVVAYRLRPGLAGWWAALLLLGYQWSFGLERLGTIWAPYTVALPVALLVLLIANVVASQDPWWPTIAAAVCASFLAQTDLSTIVLVVVLVVAAPFLRWFGRTAIASRAGTPTPTPGAPPSEVSGTPGWGWSVPKWRSKAGILVGLMAVLWLPPLIQQLSSHPGNVSQVYRFLTTHHAEVPWRTSLRAADTLFGSFPFRTGEAPATHDSTPGWLVANGISHHPWYLLYLLGVVLAVVLGLMYRHLPAFALGATSFVGMVAAAWSILLVYGPLYPYLVIWTGALVVPAWIAVWLAVAPLATALRHRDVPLLSRLSSRSWPSTWAPPGVPVVGLAAAVAVCTAYASSPVPLTQDASVLARRSWDAVAAATLAPGVKTVYVDITTQQAMPEAAAIADQAIRYGRKVEINHSALYYLDPSFASRSGAQLSIVVCCGAGDPGAPPAGVKLTAVVGGQGIYDLPDGVKLHRRGSHDGWVQVGRDRPLEALRVRLWGRAGGVSYGSRLPVRLSGDLLHIHWSPAP
jgi:hypothetical protein